MPNEQQAKVLFGAEALDAMVWAICAAADGAGKGACDPNHCVCLGEAISVLSALRVNGFVVSRAEG